MGGSCSKPVDTITGTYVKTTTYQGSIPEFDETVGGETVVKNKQVTFYRVHFSGDDGKTYMKEFDETRIQLSNMYAPEKLKKKKLTLYVSSDGQIHGYAVAGSKGIPLRVARNSNGDLMTRGYPCEDLDKTGEVGYND